MLNRFVGVGRLGRPPEAKNGSGTPLTKFSVATETSWTVKGGQTKKRTDWIPCITWGPVAEQAARFQKSDVVYLEGRFSTSTWTDKSGQKRYMSEITVEFVRPIPFNMSGPIISAVAGALAMVRLLLSQITGNGEPRRFSSIFSGGDDDYDRRSGEEFDRHHEESKPRGTPGSAESGSSDFDGPSKLGRPAPGEGASSAPGEGSGDFPGGGEDDDIPF